MRKILSKEDCAISKAIGVVLIVVIAAVSIFSIFTIQNSPNTVPVKADAYTKVTSICDAYGYNTTVSFDVTNFTLKSVSNSKINVSLEVINNSGAFVYQGNLGERSLSPYNLTVKASSNNFSVNSNYKIYIYNAVRPSSISLTFSYSGSVIYRSGQINESSSTPNGFTSSASTQFSSTGNSTSVYNTSIFLNVSAFSSGSVLSSKIGITFRITNSTGTYNYKGNLGGNIYSSSSNSSIATFIVDPKYFSGGSDYTIHLYNNALTTSISIELIYCNEVIYSTGTVT